VSATAGRVQREHAEPVPVARMPARVRVRRALPGLASALLLLLVMLILFGPIVLLAVLSFDHTTIIALDWNGFTTQWYRDAWNNSDLRAAVWNSLKVATVVTAISMVLGTMSAFAITRFRFHGRGAVAGLVGAPLIVPWLMIGIGAAIFFFHYHVPWMFPLSLHSVTAVQIICTFPLVTAIVVARLARFDWVQEEAAIDLGASRFQVLRRVVLPQLTPSLGAAAIFAFSWSFNNFEIDFFVGGYDQTFPVWVYSELRRAPNLPIINASSTLISVVQVLMVLVAWWFLRAAQEDEDRGGASVLVDAVK
jgi:ABC-type spermidine/putrescine transport system permease subunit II